jgi:hypothetical protein
MPIAAKVRSDDYVHQVKFDAEPWFVQASDQEILSLAGTGWGDNYVAEAVVEYFDGNPRYVTVHIPPRFRQQRSRGSWAA